jgi:hypothetical protein
MSGMAEIHQQGHFLRGKTQQVLVVEMGDEIVGENAGFKVIGVFPAEIQGCRHGLGDVAGGAEALADDVSIGLGLPFFGFGARNPVACLALDGGVDVESFADAAKHADQGVSGTQNIRVGVGEANVELDGSA